MKGKCANCKEEIYAVQPGQLRQRPRWYHSGSRSIFCNPDRDRFSGVPTTDPLRTAQSDEGGASVA